MIMTYGQFKSYSGVFDKEKVMLPGVLLLKSSNEPNKSTLEITAWFVSAMLVSRVTMKSGYKKNGFATIKNIIHFFFCIYYQI